MLPPNWKPLRHMKMLELRYDGPIPPLTKEHARKLDEKELRMVNLYNELNSLKDWLHTVVPDKVENPLKIDEQDQYITALKETMWFIEDELGG